MFEMNMSKRELDMAKKLGCKKQVIRSACRKAKISEIKFMTAREELFAMLKTAIPNITKWKLEFKSQEVEYETN